MTNDRLGKVLRTMAEIVSEHESGLHSSDVIAELERRIPPEGAERESYASHPDRTKMGTQAMFASTGLVKAGWVRKLKGTWIITEEGRVALKTYPASADFYAELGRLYRQWRNSEVSITEIDGEVASTGQAAIAYESAQEQASDDIQTYLGNLPPSIFEELIEHLLRAMGYYVAYRAASGPDGGIDLVAYEDPLGAKGARVKVQAKRYQNPVGKPVIQELIGSLAADETGLIVALSDFTKEAKQFARAHQTRRITLIDGVQLVELWIQYYNAIPEEGRQILRLSPVFFRQQD